MGTYIARRLLLMIPTLLIVSFLVFFIIRLIPGSALDVMVSRLDINVALTPEMMEDLKRELGIDKPIYVQYGEWIWNIITRGDLGTRMWVKTPVTQEIINRLPITFELGLFAVIIGQMIALPIGVYSAIRQDTVADYIGRMVAITGLAIPNFWLATMVVVFPSIWWRWAPPIELIRFTEDPMGNLGQFLVPAVILGMRMSATTMRMTRSMMLEVLRQDYIRTAWSKGLKERVIVLRHALKNAFIPVITIIGLQLPIMIGGTVIIEQIFMLPGIGRLVVESAFERDYPSLSGAVLVIAGAVLAINLLIDLTYAYLDPRVKYS